MTAAEILAALAEDPTLAVEVAAGLPGLRIAGPWQADGTTRFVRAWLGTSLDAAWAEVEGIDWVWWVREASDGDAPTREEALAAADAALVAAGWKLTP